MNKLLYFLILIATLTLFAEEPKAKDDKKTEKKRKPDVFNIGEIVVTAKRIANIERISTTTTVTAKEIESHGDKTLDETLSRIPGIQVYRHTKGFSRIKIRGFDQDKVMVLLDGIPLSDIYSSELDISSIPVKNISKIVINRGVSSALYGTDGAVGSINVITKKPTSMFTNGSAEYGSYNNYTLSLSHGAPIGKFYYWITGVYMNSEGYKPSARLTKELRTKWFNKFIRYDRFGLNFDEVTFPAKDQYINDDGKWNHESFRKASTSMKLGYEFKKHTEAGINGDLFYMDGKTNTYQMNCYSDYNVANEKWRDSKPWFQGEQQDIKNVAFRNRSFEWPKIYRYTVSPYFRTKYKNLSIKMNAFYFQNHLVQTGYATNDHSLTKDLSAVYSDRRADPWDPFNDIKRYSSYGFRIFPSWKLTSWYRINAAIHWRNDFYESWEQALSSTSAPDLFELMGSEKFAVRDINARYMTIAIEDELKLGRFRMSSGISWDMQKVINFKIRDGLEMTDFYLPKDDSSVHGTRDAINPVIAMMYDPIKNHLRLRASVGKKTRFPMLGEYAKIANSESDQGLKPEHSINANMGAEVFFFNKKLQVRADYFVSSLRDRIVKVSKDDPPVNVKHITAQGMELLFSGKKRDLFDKLDLSFSGSYTLLKAKNHDNSPEESVNKGTVIDRIPEHFITFDLAADLNWKNKIFPTTTFSLWGTVALGYQTYIMKEVPEEFDPWSTDYYELTNMHDPIMLHLRLTQAITKFVDLSFTIRNILDDYDYDPFNPGPGRRFFGEIAFKL